MRVAETTTAIGPRIPVEPAESRGRPAVLYWTAAGALSPPPNPDDIDPGLG